MWFNGYYDKKNILPLKWRWIKNNFETTDSNYGSKENCKTTVCDCDFKDIFETFKTTVTNYGSKENCKTIVINCGFQDIYETFKITVINDGFIYLK